MDSLSSKYVLPSFYIREDDAIYTGDRLSFYAVHYQLSLFYHKGDHLPWCNDSF
jgi:hypothetical protein